MAKKYIEADKFWNRLISVSENDWVGFDTIDEVLSGMPAEPRWIPVTERFPENNDEVLTTYIVNGNKKKRYTETATYYDDDDGGEWSSPWDEYRVAGTRIEVIAWMPLPKPYKEDEDE